MEIKKIVLSSIFLVINVIGCKSQTLPLNAALKDIPNNAYVKDLKNELAAYSGIYKSKYLGNEITLFITKVNSRLEIRSQKQFYRDALVIKYVIQKPNGQILQDTQNLQNPKIELYSTRLKSSINTVFFYYSGTNCGVGWGSIELKKINPTQLSWDYSPNDSVIDSSKCPSGTDMNIYLPETKGLIFTKL